MLDLSFAFTHELPALCKF